MHGGDTLAGKQDRLDGVVLGHRARQDGLVGAPGRAPRGDTLPDRLQDRLRIVRVEGGVDRDQGVHFGGGEERLAEGAATRINAVDPSRRMRRPDSAES